MEIYYITTFILLVFSLNEAINTNSKKKKIFLFFSFILLVCVFGLRWETGTDWISYLSLFEMSDSWQSFLISIIDIEVGYVFLNYLIRNITVNYTYFLLFHAAVMYFFIIYSLNKLTNYPQSTLLLLFCSMLGMTGSNRQLLALSLCMFALTLLVKRKKIPFFGVVASAFIFHITSIFFSIYYFFNQKFKKLYLYGVIVLAYIIGKSQMPIMIFSFFGGISNYASSKTESYVDASKEVLQSTELSLLGLLKRLFLVFIFIQLRDRISRKMPNYNLFLNGYIMGIVFYFFFSSTLLVMVSRGSLYFYIMEPLLLSSIIYILKNKIDKLLYILSIMILGIILMYQSISVYPDLFVPYKGIFINTLFKRTMH